MDRPGQDDTKIAFFLRHRGPIVEWAGVRRRAVKEFDNALVEGLGNVDFEAISPAVSYRLTSDDRRSFRLSPVARTDRVWVTLAWWPRQLLVPGAETEFPILTITVDEKADAELREAAREATREFATENQYAAVRRHSWWLWAKQIRPGEVEFDFSDYAASCAAGLRSLYRGVGDRIEQVLWEHQYSSQHTG